MRGPDMRLISVLLAAAMLSGCFAFIPEHKLKEWSEQKAETQRQKAQVLSQGDQIKALEKENADLKRDLSALKARCGEACAN
jgi:predicted RNase H-like nuclease (RuvC/YqgF family)